MSNCMVYRETGVLNNATIPILLYSSEMWGFGTSGALEYVQLR